MEGTWFKMEQREDGFYQSAYENGKARSERFDLVIGSGRRGQSYLYWRKGLLFQLPVSYLVAPREWINSPGYEDARVHFDRLIPPRCLECHSTYFRLESDRSGARYGSDYTLGLSCRTCHVRTREHKELRNPARFSRERRIDACALCHSGMREPKGPSFSYRPGEDLSQYLGPELDPAHARADVHGNQVALLRASKCFQGSPEMDCTTCHNVHKEERNLAELSHKCTQCHTVEECKFHARAGPLAADNCVACHMPNQPSNVITFNKRGGRTSQLYRTHTIGIYPDATEKALQLLGREQR